LCSSNLYHLTKQIRKVNDGLSTLATSLLPFYINYLGGNWTAASQCASGGSNSWFNNHLALNGDLNDQWAWDNTAMSWTHFQRQDLPLHFALAEGWTLADMYQVSRHIYFQNL
jgi:phospholipase C